MGHAQDRQAALPPSPGGQPPAGARPGFLLMNLGNRVRSDVESLLRQQGYSLRHLSALGHLAREPGLSYSELARRAGITVQSMQATLRQLEDRGSVERRTPTGRGRTADLHLTPAGNALLQHGEQALTDIEQRLLGGLPEEDCRHLTAILLRIFLDAPSVNAECPTGPHDN